MAETIVTRFAPSPTGYLHIGGARTALFNWLYARRAGGTFILRIEDTDIKRNTPTATAQVMNDLRWLGINWDEGPQVDGPNGPYFQSQRLDIYNKYLKRLLDEGKAYYCFDTAAELEQMRKQAQEKKTGFTYSRPERLPTEDDLKKAQAQGRPATIRFAMPDTEILVQDLVRGEVRFAAGEIGDFIIQKSDGFPTYHFACIVDDELMGVTHVIRGQEHLTNTPGHIALQDALGFRRPAYAHMSVTVSAGGGKLSKRERPKSLKKAIKEMGDVDIKKLAQVASVGAEEIEGFLEGKTVPDIPAVDAMADYLGVKLPEINVVDFFRNGYLPETMINFIALLGWNPGDEREIMSRKELIEAFDLDRLTRSNSLFDRDKLVAFNTEHIRTTELSVLLGHFKKYLSQIKSSMSEADDQLLLRILELCRGARTLADIEKKSRFLFVADDKIEYDEKAVKKVLLKGEALAILAVIRDRLDAMEQLTEQNIESLLRAMAAERGVGLGKVAQPLRVALCGTTISLPIFDSVQMLGKQRTLKRIDMTLDKFKAPT